MSEHISELEFLHSQIKSSVEGKRPQTLQLVDHAGQVLIATLKELEERLERLEKQEAN